MGAAACASPPDVDRPVQQRKKKSLPHLATGAGYQGALGKEPMEVDPDARALQTGSFQEGGHDLDVGRETVRGGCEDGHGLLSNAGARQAMKAPAALPASSRPSSSHASNPAPSVPSHGVASPTGTAGMNPHPASIRSPPRAGKKAWATVRSNLGRSALNASETRSGSTSPKKGLGFFDVVQMATQRENKVCNHEAQEANVTQVAKPDLCA